MPHPTPSPLPESLVFPYPCPHWVINSQSTSEGPFQPQFLIWFGQERLFPGLGNNQAWHSPGHKCASPWLCATVCLPPCRLQVYGMDCPHWSDKQVAWEKGLKAQNPLLCSFPIQGSMRCSYKSPTVSPPPLPMPLPSMAGST